LQGSTLAKLQEKERQKALSVVTVSPIFGGLAGLLLSPPLSAEPFSRFELAEHPSRTPYASPIRSKKPTIKNPECKPNLFSCMTVPPFSHTIGTKHPSIAGEGFLVFYDVTIF